MITEDVPLADRIVESGGSAISPHGKTFTTETIKEQLALRNLSQELRSAGELKGGQKEFSHLDVRKFAAALDKFISKK